MLTIAIDPSIKSLGYAIFINEELYASGTLAIPIDTSKPLVQRIIEMYQLVSLTFEPIITPAKLANRQCILIIEQPQVFVTPTQVANVSTGSFSAQDILKLTMMVGALIAFGYERRSSVQLVTPIKWKGNLKKWQTKERMEKKYSKVFRTPDESDAVGIGDWFIGQLAKKGLLDDSTTTAAETGTTSIDKGD